MLHRRNFNMFYMCLPAKLPLALPITHHSSYLPNFHSHFWVSLGKSLSSKWHFPDTVPGRDQVTTCLTCVRCDELLLFCSSSRASYTFWLHVFLNVLIPDFSDHYRNLNLFHEPFRKVSSTPSQHAGWSVLTARYRETRQEVGKTLMDTLNRH